MTTKLESQKQVDPPFLLPEEIFGLEKQAEEVFERWVCEIYEHSSKLAELNIFGFGEEFMDISPAKMNNIVMKYLQKMCENHMRLVKESIELLMGQEIFYHQTDQEQIDFEILPLKDLIIQEQQILKKKKSNQRIKKQIDLQIEEKKTEETYLWFIYQHFSSIAKANSEISQLIDIMEQNSEAIYNIQTHKEFDFQKQERKIDDNEHRYRQTELNQITIRKLVPENCELKFCDFKQLIDNIVRFSSQNMRKQNRYVEKFVKSLQIGTPDSQLPQVNVNFEMNVLDHFPNPILNLMNKNFLQKDLENETYYADRDQLNFHECISMTNYESEKAEDQEIFDLEVKKKKKNKKKKKKKKLEENLELIKHKSEGVQLEIKKEEEKPKEHDLVIQMLCDLKISKERQEVQISRRELEKWWMKLKKQF